MSIFLEFLASGVVDDSGDPLNAGQVFVYQTGTTQKQDVFSDSGLTVPLSNPITLDAAGKATAYTSSQVRLVIEDSLGNSVDDYDPIGTEAQATATSTIVTNQLVPIGSIIPFYDFDAAISFSDDYWAYCDGSTALVGGVSRTLPDLSNRYLIGFGTEGGGDIDTATWSTTAVGNADHEVDISHTHTVSGSLTSVIQLNTNPTFGNETAIDASNQDIISELTTAGSGITALAKPTDALTGTAASGGSATQDIQPRSIQVRFIMRIK